MKYIFTPTAEEQFDNLTSLNRRHISAKMRFFAAQDDPFKFAEPLAGSDEYRFRIGDYLVIFEVLHDALWVTAIKRRTRPTDELYFGVSPRGRSVPEGAPSAERDRRPRPEERCADRHRMEERQGV